jgi:extracellular elastinolytic metalloproteinase
VNNSSLNFAKLRSDGTVLSYGNSLYHGDIPTEFGSNSINAVEALDVVRSILELPLTAQGEATSEDDDGRVIIKGIEGAKEDPEAQLIYFVKPDGELTLTWKVKTRVQDTSFTSYVDAANGNAELVGVLDHMSHATYQV